MVFIYLSPVSCPVVEFVEAMYVIQGQAEPKMFGYGKQLPEQKNPLTAQDTNAFIAFMAIYGLSFVSCLPHPSDGSSM